MPRTGGSEVAPEMRIDAYAHAVPAEFRRAVVDRVGESHLALSRWSIPTLTDEGLHLAIMDEFGIDMQILSMGGPPLEELFAQREATELARLANEGMAEVVARHKGRFAGVATLAMGDPDGACRELERAVRVLGLRGAFVYTNAGGRPLDEPELEPFFALVEELDVPVWLHPARPEDVPDYPGEDRSLYGIWLTFSWPYATTVAMARLVFGGVLQRHPRLRVIAHHAGAMVPTFARRLDDVTRPEWIPPEIRPPYLDHFRRFYVDTVTQGSLTALLAAWEVFGADHVLFGTDMPFGAEQGRQFVREAVQSLEWLPLPPADKERIWSGNALRLCGLGASCDA